MTETLAQQLRDAHERLQVRDRAAATGSLLAAEEQDPDSIAAGRQAGQVLQIPAAAADLDPEGTQKQAKAKEYRDALDASPKLKDWVQQPGNALIAHDDTERLSWWEQIGGLGQSFGAAIPETVGIGLQGLNPPMILGSGMAVEDLPLHLREDFLGFEREAHETLHDFGQNLEAFGQSIDVPDEERTIANDIAGAIGQLTGQVALFFAGRSGRLTNLLLFFGTGRETQRRMQIDQGVDPDAPGAQIAQVLGGLVTLATEKVGLDILLARVPTLRNRALQLLLGTGKGAVAEGTQEVTESILQQVITNALADDDRSLFDDLGRDFAVGGSAGGLIGFLRELLTPGRRRRATLDAGDGEEDATPSPQQEAAADAAAISAINDNARESKLAQRSPDDYQSFVEEATQGTERDTLYVPAEEMNIFLQSKGEDPKSVAESLGLDYSEVLTAAQAGTRVAIPTSAYAARLAAGEHGEWFAANASFTPTGRTLADQANEELATSLRQQGEELQQQIDQELELQAADQQVADAMLSEFTSAGMAPGVAGQLSQAVAAFFRTLGRRTGTDALEAFRAVGGIKVRGEIVERLSRLDRDELDKVIDLARTGRTKSNAKREETLIPFLARQGLVDDGGELQAIGAEKLVKAGGRTLDDAAVAAAEAGYLPELRAELEGDRLATLNPRRVLLDAMDRELRGAPVRLPDDTADRADSQAAAVEDLIETAAQLGVDLNQDNESIKTQLDLGVSGKGPGPTVDDLPPLILKQETGGDEAGGRRERLELEASYREFLGDPDAQPTDREFVAGEVYDLMDLPRFFEQHIKGRKFGDPAAPKVRFRLGQMNPATHRDAERFGPDVSKVSPVATVSAQSMTHTEVVRGKDMKDLLEALPRLVTERAEVMRGNSPNRIILARRLRLEDGTEVGRSINQMAIVEAVLSADGMQVVTMQLIKDKKLIKKRGKPPFDDAAGGGGGEPSSPLGAGAPHADTVDDPGVPPATSNVAQDPEEVKFEDLPEIDLRHNKIFPERVKGILRGFTSVPVTGIRPDAPATIFLTKDYDLSTALHELGHAFLEIQLATLRENPDATGLKEDTEALKAWWGRNAEAVAKEATGYLEGDGVITAEEVTAFLEGDLQATGERTRSIHTALHEQFARGFEAYLFEGKAPSAGLRDVFRRFKSWLLLIYRQVRRLGVRLDDQAREVFDRMLATEEEIADARELAGKVTPIEAPELDWMTPKQQEAYRKKSQEALERSREAVLSDLMGELSQTQSKEYERIRKETKAAATQIVNARPVYRAREWLQNSRWLGDGQPQDLPETKLNKRDLIDLGYEGNLRNPTNRAAGNVILPPIYSAKGGVHPDVLAGLFGFRTGDGMVRAILSSPDRQTAIEEETDSMMRERVGDMLRDGRIEEEALAAVHGEDFAGVIEAEVRALTSDRPEFQAALSKEAALEAEKIAVLWAPRQAKPELYLRAERGAAEASRRALQRGDRQEALKHKQRQLLNHHLWREAKAANEFVEKLLGQVSRYRRKAVRQNIGPDYIAQIDDLLERYDFVKRSVREIRRAESLVEFVQRMELEGRAHEVDIDPRVIARAMKTHYTRVPIVELMGLQDALKNLEHLGRLKTALLLENERRELELVVDAVETSVRGSGEFVQQRIGRGTPKQQRGDRLQQYGNLIFTPDTILKELDGGRDLGPAMEHLKRPIDRAISDKYIPMKEKADNDLAEIFNRYSKREQKAMKVRRELPGIQQPMTKWQMISVALNWGNAGNQEALLDGNFDISQIEIILDQLTKKDWEFVQAVWDYLETYYPMIAELQVQRTGVAPEKVPALSIATKHGTFSGGYYPLRYDGGNSTKVGDEDVQNLSREMLAGRFSKAATARGHTIERVGSGGRPVLLEISVLPQHLQRVTYDLAVGEAVHYTNRVLNHPRTRKAFEETGRQQTWRTLDLWVKDTAAGETPAGDIEEAIARRIRTGFSVSVMGFNLGTALLQPLGILQTSVQLGKRHTVKGVLKLATSSWAGPRSVFKEIYELSPVMRNRTEGWNKDVAAAVSDLKAAFPDWLVEAAFYMISRTQQVVDAATWLGAYSKGQEKFAGNLEKARDFADGVVKTSQASPLLTDRSGLERGTTSERKRQSELVRMLWTTMASYMYAKANVATQRTRETNFRSPKQVAAWAGDMALLFVVETMLVAVMRGTWPDDEEDIPGFVGRETLFTVLAGFPGIREVTTEVQGFRGGGSLAAFIQAAGRLVTETSDDDASPQDFKAINDVGGIIFRYPSKQINRTVDALIRDIEGEDVAPIDYIMWRQK